MCPAPLDVTATVCNYNGRTYLGECLEALLRQTRPPRRIVVYDNASDDGSAELVRECFPQVELVEMGDNRGPCTPRNRGLREADSAWVLQVDSDAILADDCLELLWREVGDPEVDCVMPRALFHADRSRVHYDGGTFHYVGILTLHHFFAALPEGPEEPVDIDAAIAMALLLRRERVLEIGGYEPEFFILFEDHDLSYRLRASGGRIRRVPAARVFHREGTAGISYREGPSYPRRRVFLHSRNRWMVLIRNHSWCALLLGLPGILLYDLFWMAFATSQRALPAWLRGKLAVLRLLPRLLRERREIQARRRLGDGALLRAEPLTHAPMVSRGRLRGLAEGALSGALRGWWRLVGWLVP